MAVGRRRAFGGLLVRREVWIPSWRGLLAICLIVLGAIVGSVRELYPFLAAPKFVPSQVLVIDAWMPTVALQAVAHTYAQDRFSQAIVVGAYYSFDEVDGDPGNLEVVKATLVRAGIPPHQLHGIVYSGVARDRTYAAAIAVRRWLAASSLSVHGLDVATLGPHSRRSRLLYQMAFGPDMQIGVIPVRDPAYDSRRWWRFSEGIRQVLFEGVAYLYARFFFRLDPSS